MSETEAVKRPLADVELRVALAITPQPRRPCGDCSLCCKLLPVVELEKPRNHWCRHVAAGKHACTVYAARPDACRLWSCGYVLLRDPPPELMPSRCHCVFDMMVDKIWIHGAEVAVMQIWVDPAYPYAHRAPAVRRQIKAAAEQGFVSLARIGTRGVVIVPPETGGEEWIEREARTVGDPNQTWEMRMLGKDLPERTA